MRDLLFGVLVGFVLGVMFMLAPLTEGGYTRVSVHDEGLYLTYSNKIYRLVEITVLPLGEAPREGWHIVEP